MTNLDVPKLIGKNKNVNKGRLEDVLSVVRELRGVGVMPVGYRIEPAFGRSPAKNTGNAISKRIKVTDNA